MSGMTPEQRLSSLESRTDNAKEQISKLEATTTEIKTAIAELRNDLKWHRFVGWGIAVVYASIFVWFVNSYLPDKFNDKLPANFREDWGRLQQNVGNIQTRLNHLTPSAIDNLLPLPDGTTPPLKVVSRLQKASQVINTSLSAQIPGDPEALGALKGRINDLVDEYKAHPEVGHEAISTEVRLAAYQVASSHLLEGLKPATAFDPSLQSVKTEAYYMHFVMTCKYPTAGFLNVVNPATRPSVVVFDVHVETCRQEIQGVRWLDDRFTGSTIEYSGGPLYLAGVIFTNCRLRFGSDPQSKRALAAIMASNGRPVNLLIE